MDGYRFFDCRFFLQDANPSLRSPLSCPGQRDPITMLSLKRNEFFTILWVPHGLVH